MSATFRPVVITLMGSDADLFGGVLDRVRASGLPVIVVNDGVAAVLAGGAAERSGVRVVGDARNRERGAALRAGFVTAAEMGYTHAARVDADGGYDPEQIPVLLALAKEAPEALVLGYRDDAAAGGPARVSAGRRVTNFLVLLESGLRVRDSRCGLRVYPLGLANAIARQVGRSGFEAEMVTRAGWAGCAVVESPVRCGRAASGRDAGCVRRWGDWIREAWMHVRLLARAMWPWPHKRWSVRAAGDDSTRRRSGWGGLVEWLNPARAWRQLRNGDFGRTELAAGVAVGIFIANLPVYGGQTLLALYTARRLHLHPLPVVAGSQVSTPPVGPVLVAAAIWLGHVLLHGGAVPAWRDLDVTRLGMTGVVGPLLEDWAVGSIVMGLVTAAVGFVVVSVLFRYVQADRVTERA